MSGRYTRGLERDAFIESGTFEVADPARGPGLQDCCDRAVDFLSVDLVCSAMVLDDRPVMQIIRRVGLRELKS